MRILSTIVVIALTASGAWGMGQRHEHPTGSEHPAKEHPEGAEKAGTRAETLVTSEQTLDAVAEFIRDYVDNQPPKGKVAIQDPKTGEKLKLKLDKVHRKRLAQVGPDKYFVCANFKSPDGTVYDLDFFVRRTGEKQFELIEGKKSLHKVAGKARYTWYYDKDEGVWKKRAAKHKCKQCEKKAEHPEEKKQKEHPTGGGSEHPSGGGSEHPH